MHLTQKIFLSVMALTTVSFAMAQCPNCQKSNQNNEVRVRGVLQKKPSSVVLINQEPADNTESAQQESADSINQKE